MNLQGDVTEIRSTSNALVAQYNYDAFGNILSIKDANGNNITSSTHIANVNPLRYRGYFYDPETGFYYLNSRYYDPATRRFISADNVIDERHFDGMNLYAYCWNNPVKHIDSTGTIPEEFEKACNNYCIQHNLPCKFIEPDGRNYLANFREPKSDLPLDFTLYDSWRTSLNKGPFRSTLISLKGAFFKFNFDLKNLVLKPIDLQLDMYKIGYEWENCEIGGTLGQASAALEMGWGDEIKGIKAGAKASVASGAIAFSIGDVDITLTGDFITAGIGGEITSKGIKFNYGLGWAGGGISIGW